MFPQETIERVRHKFGEDQATFFSSLNDVQTITPTEQVAVRLIPVTVLFSVMMMAVGACIILYEVNPVQWMNSFAAELFYRIRNDVRAHVDQYWYGTGTDYEKVTVDYLKESLEL